jgi:hypothetical protein
MAYPVCFLPIFNVKIHLMDNKRAVTRTRDKKRSPWWRRLYDPKISSADSPTAANRAFPVWRWPELGNDDMPSPSLLDIHVIYCGDNLEQLANAGKPNGNSSPTFSIG